MIQKQNFYRGAAIAAALEDRRCTSIRQDGDIYRVNGTAAFIVKYSTKSRSPWQFAFTDQEVKKLLANPEAKLALVCGGDGICSLPIRQALELIGSRPGWLSVKRTFNKSYGVGGSVSSLNSKISQNSWPSLLFSQNVGP